MSALVRSLQLLGVVVVLTSAFFPTLALRVYPAVEGTSPWHSAAFVAGTPETPSLEIRDATQATLRGESARCPFWDARRWYPWYLALLWVPALLLVWRRPAGDLRRRIVGALLWGMTGVLLVFEAAYLYQEYLPLLPGVFGRAEVVLAWLLVASILLFRRRGDRTLGAVEATVASQALLGFVHALTLPGTMGRAWVGAYPLDSIAAAVWLNFPPAFWIGCAGMLLASVPVYLARKRALRSSAPPS